MEWGRNRRLVGYGLEIRIRNGIGDQNSLRDISRYRGLGNRVYYCVYTGF